MYIYLRYKFQKYYCLSTMYTEGLKCTKKRRTRKLEIILLKELMSKKYLKFLEKKIKLYFWVNFILFITTHNIFSFFFFCKFKFVLYVLEKQYQSVSESFYICIFLQVAGYSLTLIYDNSHPLKKSQARTTQFYLYVFLLLKYLPLKRQPVLPRFSLIKELLPFKIGFNKFHFLQDVKTMYL